MCADDEDDVFTVLCTGSFLDPESMSVRTYGETGILLFGARGLRPKIGRVFPLRCEASPIFRVNYRQLVKTGLNGFAE